MSLPDRRAGRQAADAIRPCAALPGRSRPRAPKKGGGGPHRWERGLCCCDVGGAAAVVVAGVGRHTGTQQAGQERDVALKHSGAQVGGAGDLRRGARGCACAGEAGWAEGRSAQWEHVWCVQEGRTQAAAGSRKGARGRPRGPCAACRQRQPAGARGRTRAPLPTCDISSRAPAASSASSAASWPPRAASISAQPWSREGSGAGQGVRCEAPDQCAALMGARGGLAS
jgi:hypothetical protein